MSDMTQWIRYARRAKLGYVQDKMEKLIIRSHNQAPYERAQTEEQIQALEEGLRQRYAEENRHNAPRGAQT